MSLVGRVLHILRTEGLGSTFSRMRAKTAAPSNPLGVLGLEEPFATQIELSDQETRDRIYFRSLEAMQETANRPGPNYCAFEDQEVQTALKAIAFYLPQYHPIPENDSWWGRGFTEWTNVSRAVPQYLGHYQPHLPGELNFYDLRLDQILERQVELARSYGIFGFAFYHYWFSGRRLLEAPVDSFINNFKIDFPFCLMWANESWSRRWDGLESDVLLNQEHTLESDRRFINDLVPFLKRPNYIRLEGRPLIMVYRAQLMEDAPKVTAYWRRYCQDAGLGDPMLVAAQAFGLSDPRSLGFDAAITFAPLGFQGIPTLQKRDSKSIHMANPGFRGETRSYPEIVKHQEQVESCSDFPLFETICPSWDNTARKGANGHSLAFSSPDLYQTWLGQAADRAVNDPLNPQNLLFINAWNEWAEGTHLEPDQRHGYAYLNATRNALQAPSKKPVYGRTDSVATVKNDSILDPGGVFSELLPTTSGVRIVPIRDPISRQVSAFLGCAHEYIPKLDERIKALDICGDELREIFVQFFEIESMDAWLSRRGLDPYGKSYDPLSQSLTISDDQGPVVFIRMDQKPERLAKLLKIVGPWSPPPIAPNIMARERLFREAAMPFGWVTEMLSSRFAKHFFLDTERGRILRYWTKARD